MVVNFVKYVVVHAFAGSGFVSHDLYNHGFFSASIKLPADYTAGVVVAFYVSGLKFVCYMFVLMYVMFFARPLVTNC